MPETITITIPISALAASAQERIAELTRERDLARRQCGAFRIDSSLADAQVACLRAERDSARKERETMRQERDAARQEANTLTVARDELKRERDAWVKEHESIRRDRETMRRERDEALVGLARLLDTLGAKDFAHAGRIMVALTKAIESLGPFEEGLDALHAARVLP